MMKKRGLSVLCALVLVFTMLSACGQKSEISFDENGRIIPNQEMKLTVWCTQGTDYVTKNVNDDVVEKWLFDKTKVKVANVYGNDGGQWDTKLSKLVAGDNLPDILWCMSGQGPSHFNKLRELNVLYELTPEMIQKYAPNVWKRTPSDLWNEFTVDGKIIGIPFNIDVSRVNEVWEEYSEEECELIKEVYEPYVNDVTLGETWVRDDVLKMIYPNAKTYDELAAILEERQEPIGDELLDVPIFSTEDYIDFMYKIKDLNLTEDGKKVYAYGYPGDGSDNWDAICYLGAEMYGFKTHEYTATWNLKTESIEVPLTKDIIKNVAKTQNKMVNDGVIDSESLMHTIDQFKTKVFNGQYAICDFKRVGDVVAANKQLEELGKSYRYRPLYTQVPAQEGYEACTTVSKFGDSIAFFNCLDEEDIIQLLNWIDVQYTEEFDDIYHWGAKEDGLYTETDGTRSFNDERFNSYFVNKDASAMATDDTKGLGNMGGKLYVRPILYTKYKPDIYVKNIAYLPTAASGFRFSNASEHVTNVKNVPTCRAYSPEFAAIPEVVKYWGAREQWETAVKKAFAAAPGEFDKKWEEAMNILNGIVDVEKMEEEMTKIAKNNE